MTSNVNFDYLKAVWEEHRITSPMGQVDALMRDFKSGPAYSYKEILRLQSIAFEAFHVYHTTSNYSVAAELFDKTIYELETLLMKVTKRIDPALLKLNSSPKEIIENMISCLEDKLVASIFLDNWHFSNIFEQERSYRNKRIA